MPTVHSVSDITRILSGIIQNEPALQKVWVHGKILETLPLNRLTFGDTGCSIDCRNHSKNPNLFADLGVGKVYYAYGGVIVNPQKSKYRFAVTKIQPNQPPNLFKDSSSLTEKLKQTIKQLEVIQVHGKISSITQKSGFTLLHLKDENGEMIECAIPQGIDPGIALNPGNDVCVCGQINIFQKASLYQILIANADDIMSGPSLDRCECSGCRSCQPPGAECNQTRNSQYKLCFPCYAISPDHEKRVEEAVEAYFFDLKVKGFSPKTQHGIQIGSENRIADVVLTNGNRNFASIAECKGAGFIGDGREQLYSYLSATDTRFGVFANTADPNHWEFYENRRRNRFDRVTRDQFENAVVKGITCRKQLKDEIRSLESNRNRLHAEIGGLKTEKAEAATQVREESQKLSAVKQTIESDRAHNQALKSIQKHLSDAIEQLRMDKTKLETEVGEIERKKRELYASRKQRKEKIQQLETLLDDLKSGLSDLEPSPTSEDNTDPQKPRENKKWGIKSWFKNLFSKEQE